MKKKKMLIIPLLLLALLGYLFFEPRWIQLKVYKETSADIPEPFKGLRIVFVSDIHHSDFLSYDRVVKLVDRINGLKPDLILLGGDYANRIAYTERCFEALKALRADRGVFGVLGNHDHWAGAAAARKYMEAAGITPLDNNSVWLEKGGQRIKIGGVGDLWTDKQDLTGTISDVKKDDFVLLLSHNPDYVETIKSDKVDLVLSGHSHGGQVTLFGLWALTSSRYGMKYRTGLVETDYTKVLVSNGIGTVFHPFRFWARPQINVVELTGKGN